MTSLSTDKQDAERYRWLRSHIAATIVRRFDAECLDWRPEKMDELIDGRLALKAVRDGLSAHDVRAECSCPGDCEHPGTIVLKCRQPSTREAK